MAIGQFIINFINFDLNAYEILNNNTENKSTDFYGHSFFATSNGIRINSQNVCCDGFINIINFKNKLKKFIIKRILP